ncbi:MAG: hypothetical protein J4400_03050 [Candidatus Aenigmarchaeota archaeon]|nr:hypothetical protein [Candidatus Aenigmarchaeota archaeon]
MDAYVIDCQEKRVVIPFRDMFYRFCKDYESLLRTGESSRELVETGSDIVRRAMGAFDTFMQPEVGHV